MILSVRRVATLALAVALAACAGTLPQERYYTLSGPTTPPPAATAQGPSVFVSVAVPEGVDRSPMVLRTGANQVEITDFHRWAEPLKAAIPRVLAANLARELGGARVSSGRGSGACSLSSRSRRRCSGSAWTRTRARSCTRTARSRSSARAR